ncbi:hypothetical protein RA271_30240, partial [Pseudomonas syringae pv. tagetis]
LLSKVQGLVATAAAALGQCRERHISQPLANSPVDVSLALLGNRALLMIMPESADMAIGLFSSAWNNVARSRQLTIGE